MGGTSVSRILTVTIFALMLAGCASEPSYDKSAMLKATDAVNQATAMCEKEQTPSKFTAYKFMACRVAAERNFAMEIHLSKMDVFDIYADKMLALAADYDAGHFSLMRMARRAASIRDDYRRACDCLKDRQPISYDWAPSPTPEHP
jgi:hypothetical protein